MQCYKHAQDDKETSFVVLFLIVIKYTYHKINHFQAHRSVVLSTITSLCNQSPELFSYPSFEVYLLHNVGLISAVQQSDSVRNTHTLFFMFLCAVAYHGLLGIVLCARQEASVCPSCVRRSHLLTQPPSPPLRGLKVLGAHFPASLLWA